MPSALTTETVLIHAPDDPFEPTTGGPQGPPEKPNSDGYGGGGGDEGPDHKPTGMGLFGMRIALVPITILFIAIGYIFYARSRVGFNWQTTRAPSLLWLSTVLILVSSWTLERGRTALRLERHGEYARWMLRTLYLGLGFLASQMLALRQMVIQGSVMHGNPHGALFYIVTASHGLHLFGGLVALAYLVVRSGFHIDESTPGLAATRRYNVVTAVYWHFLTILWVGLFLLLVLWQ